MRFDRGKRLSRSKHQNELGGENAPLSDVTPVELASAQDATILVLIFALLVALRQMVKLQG